MEEEAVDEIRAYLDGLERHHTYLFPYFLCLID
jgi:hypothetical protein